MSGFIEGDSRHQSTLFPDRLDDYIAEDNSVRVIDVFVDDLDISGLGFKTEAESTGRPAYHPHNDAEDLYLRLSEPSAVESPG